MNQLFPLPIYTFLKTAFRNGGITFKGIRNLPSWFIKTLLFEPLRWVELTYNKKISQHEIPKDPIFILGFYRSGTSFMHEFLAQDHRLGYHTVFQMILPEIMLCSERVLAPFFDFICRIFNLQDPVHRIQMSFRYPGEDDATMTTMLNPRGAQWGYFFPKMMMEQFRKYVLFENIPASELEGWKADYLFLLKKISLANQGKQLILKSPPNTARINLLLSMFPSAKFIFVHRNPYEVYASNKRFWKVTDRIYSIGESKSVDKNAIILETYAKLMDRYLVEKALVPEGQLVEVPYAELIQKPMETMRKIYKTLRLEDFSLIQDKMKAYIGLQKNYTRLNHALEAEERKAVSREWEPYIRHWNYPLLGLSVD